MPGVLAGVRQGVADRVSPGQTVLVALLVALIAVGAWSTFRG